MGNRYIGAKTNILDEILAGICSIVDKGAHVIDLMCGTGTVSAALRASGFRVTAVDVMTFPGHHSRVALLFTSPPTFRDAQDFIDELGPTKQSSLLPVTAYERMIQALNNLPPKKGYFWKEFSIAGCPKNTSKPRNYFTPDNAMLIDAIRDRIKILGELEKITKLEHSLLLHDLIMAANDVANIAGTYGHYLSKTVGRAKTPMELKPFPIKIFDDEGFHTVLTGYAEDLAGSLSGDLCYIDPPYMKRQYAANYHVLETLAREDEPEAIGVSGLRPWRDQYSNFCTKTKIRDSFAKIFTEMNCPEFLVSYSEDGLLSIDELTSFFKSFGKVETSTLVNKRFKSNTSTLAPRLSEYLINLTVRK